MTVSRINKYNMKLNEAKEKKKKNGYVNFCLIKIKIINILYNNMRLK